MTIYLVDFNDLFVIAIGLSMAYMIIEKKSDNGPFYSILSNITKTIRDWALNRKAKRQQEVEANISKIDYYLKQGLLEPDTRGALKLVSDKAKDVIKSIEDLENWNDEVLSRYTKTNYLYVLCFDCFVYGLMMLFVGVFQLEENLAIEGFLLTMNFGMVLFSIHCVWFEFVELKNQKVFFRPTAFLHGVLMIIFIILGICLMDDPVLEINIRILNIFAVFICFIGFILYFITNILVNIIILTATIFKIMLLKINSSVKQQKNDINRYAVELSKIDETIRKKNLLEDDFAVKADNANTEEKQF